MGQSGFPNLQVLQQNTLRVPMTKGLAAKTNDKAYRNGLAEENGFPSKAPEGNDTKLFLETHESILAFLPASLGNSVEAIPGFQGSRNNNLAVGLKTATPKCEYKASQTHERRQ